MSFKSNTVFLFFPRRRAHRQMGTTAVLSSKQGCQSMVTMTGRLGQQHWHVQPTNSPHFSSRLFCFSFWSVCLIINDQTSSVLLDFFWDSSEASRNLLIASLLPKCFLTDFFLPPKRTKTTKSHWFSSTSFPHLNPLLYCYTVFLDHSPTLLLLLSFSPLHLGILLWLLQVPSGWQTVVVSSLEESR